MSPQQQPHSACRLRLMLTGAVKCRDVVRRDVGDRGDSLHHPTSGQVDCSMD